MNLHEMKTKYQPRPVPFQHGLSPLKHITDTSNIVSSEEFLKKKNSDMQRGCNFSATTDGARKNNILC